MFRMTSQNLQSRTKIIRFSSFHSLLLPHEPLPALAGLQGAGLTLGLGAIRPAEFRLVVFVHRRPGGVADDVALPLAEVDGGLGPARVEVLFARVLAHRVAAEDDQPPVVFLKRDDPDPAAALPRFAPHRRRQQFRLLLMHGRTLPRG